MNTDNKYPSLEFLKQIARASGAVMIQNFGLGMKFDWKEDETPVTVTDKDINLLVVERLGQHFPEVRVIGEEGSNTIADAEYTVFCDPVDGTIPYRLGIPVSTFCISLFRNGKPIMGIIYDPFSRRLWSAEKGKGAWVTYYGQSEQGHTLEQNHPISVSKQTTLDRSNLSMIWWKGSPYSLDEVHKIVMERGGHWINLASVAIFGGLIASGTVEGSIFPGKNAWETGAMQVIVEEAGGKVTDIYGNEMSYGPRGEIQGHIVSNGLIHQELVDAVEHCRRVPQT